ncbi:MAG: hypothetical protein NDI61_10165 [Bdellovibrionaceae bacterium]|nr:hypothetical protein [Pseudobdellovibrionaceae bacterium]
MRIISILALILSLSGCTTTGAKQGRKGGTGLTVMKADACAQFREAFLARDYLIRIFDPTQPGAYLLEGTATFQKHDSNPSQFAFRTVRDRAGDQHERHTFQLIPEGKTACYYSFIDEETQSPVELEIRRTGDYITVGGPEQNHGFRLSPNIYGVESK